MSHQKTAQTKKTEVTTTEMTISNEIIQSKNIIDNLIVELPRATKVLMDVEDEIFFYQLAKRLRKASTLLAYYAVENMDL